MTKKIILLSAICLLLANCATIIDGTTRSINLQPSDPDYEDTVKVQVATKNSVQTVQIPGTVILKATAGNATVTVKDKCFRQTTSEVKSKLNYWVLGNVITGGFTGTTTDALTGAMWTFDDTVVNVQENGVCKADNK